MKRLTEKNESPCTCCGGIGSCRTDCNYKQIYDRLTEYEDTGLTPKEIEDMVSVREITPEAEYAIDKHANNLIQKLEQLIAQTDEKDEMANLAKDGQKFLLENKIHQEFVHVDEDYIYADLEEIIDAAE